MYQIDNKHMTLGDTQIKLVNLVKQYYINLKSSKIDMALSSLCYFSSWGETPGYAKLKFWQRGWFFLPKFFFIILKNILSIASHTNYEEFSSQNYLNNYDILVVSWTHKKKFQTDGSYHDSYFQENSKDLPNSYWLLISLDGYVPPNLNDNIKILIKKKGIFKFNFFSFFKILVNLFFSYKFSLRKLFHYFSFYSYFAKIMSFRVKKELIKNNYKVVLLPYESQPFQHTIFLDAKKINKKIITIGYLHSLLTPFPTDFVYRTGAPDVLYVHGESQIEILKSKLNWPNNKLFLIESLRYRDDNKSFSNKIFLPHVIMKRKKLIKEFERLLVNSPSNNFANLDVLNHPLKLKSKIHLSVKSEIEGIIKIYKDRFSKNPSNNNISIFFGVTAAIFEALEKGIGAIHICADPLFESHNEKIWPNLKVNQLGECTFQYELTILNKYIKFGNKKKALYQVLKNTTQIQI